MISPPRRLMSPTATTAAVLFLLACSRSSSTSGGVAAFSLLDNPYQEPVHGRDGRSPCPALNTLANHGFIPRDGKNVSANLVATGAAEAFSISDQSVGFVLEKMIQIGLPHRIDEANNDTIFDLEDAFVVDRDISASWLDLYFRTVKEVNPCLIQELIDLAGSSDYITADHVEVNLRARFEDSRLYNPNFKFTEHVLPIAGVQYAELFVVSDDPNLEVVNKTVLYEFLRFNRFPDGYVPRSTVNPFQPKLNSTDPSALLIDRYTKVLEELVASQGVEGGAAIQRSSESDKANNNSLSSSTSKEAMCIREQPPAPPTVAPASSPAEASGARHFSLLLGGAASALVAMMVTLL